MKQINFARQLPRLMASAGLITLAIVVGLIVSCGKPREQTKPMPTPSSEIKVEVRNSGPIVTTNTAEFQVLPSGYVQAMLLKGGKRLTLDEPGNGLSGVDGYIIHDGQVLMEGKPSDVIGDKDVRRVYLGERFSL